MKPDSINAGVANTKVSFSTVKSIIDQRCNACHAQVPSQAGFVQALKGVILENATQIQQHAPVIALTVANRYMPIANLTAMTLEQQLFVPMMLGDERNIAATHIMGKCRYQRNN